MRVSPHRAIFDRPRRHGNPPVGAQIGTLPPTVGVGAAMQVDQTADSAAGVALVNDITFTYTGAIQHWTAPPGVTSALFTVEGSAGAGGPNGDGCRIVAFHSTVPGDILDLYVGGQPWPNAGLGGNAGAFAGFNGGASTDVRGPGGAFVDAWIVAAGGGAAGESSASNPNPFGGDGGFLTGGNAQNANGATVGAGGTGGPGGDGSFGQGGNALGSGNSFHFGSGGAGGGWYGGEGGVSASPPGQSGGGGGNSHVDVDCTVVSTEDGVVTGTGRIRIQW